MSKNSQIAEVTKVNGDSVLVDVGGGTLYEADLFLAPNESAKPIVGDKVLVSETEVTGNRVAIAYYDPQIETIEAGEKKIFSKDSDGNVKAEIYLKADGVILINGESVEMNGDGKRFVTYDELNTALQTFTTSLNTLIGTKLDGGGTPGTLSLDISASETNTIKTGG